MCAGISYMYKMSGGCEVMKRCADCGYLEADKENRGFGKRSGVTAESYRCSRHPVYEGSLNWKPTYTACHFHTEAKQRIAYTESADGQLSFFVR